jgi:hypothetical protein
MEELAFREAPKTSNGFSLHDKRHFTCIVPFLAVDSSVDMEMN